MRVKMLALDLDRTLLRSDKTLSDFSLRALRACAEKGVCIAFSTARPLRAVREYARAARPDALICHSGAVVHIGNVPVFHARITRETARVIVSTVSRARPEAKVSVEADDVLYANFDASVYWPGIDYRPLSDLSPIPVDKILVSIRSSEDFSELSALLPDNVCAENSNGHLMLIVNREATKLRAVSRIAHAFGISLSEIAAFGDDYSDIESLRECGVGVAVQNAIPEALQAADFVCLPNDEDGVAAWLFEHLPELGDCPPDDQLG